MTQQEPIKNMEDSLAIVRGLTFVGGYLNAYCFFTRGGAFGTFHTGNIVRVGLSVVQKDSAQFWAAMMPIIGAVVGGILANTLKLTTQEDLSYQRRVIFLQLLTFLAVGLLLSDATNSLVNFVVPMVSMFQLSSFRRARERAHNSTIMTGNLRTFAQLLFEMINKRTKKSVEDFFSYSFTFLSFFFGVVVGGYISVMAGKPAIWACAVVMAMILMFSRNYQTA